MLSGGNDYFSNGIHLNVIEAADDPAAESWRNLNAIDDLVRDIVETDSHLVISALAGDAAAGGVPLALAADYVLAHEDVVLNPYYRPHGRPIRLRVLDLPPAPPDRRHADRAPYAVRRSSPSAPARRPRSDCSTPSWARASRTSRLDVRAFGKRIAHDGLHRARLEDKRRRRAHDERLKRLHAYRSEELADASNASSAPTPAYHEARRRFVFKARAPQDLLRRAA